MERVRKRWRPVQGERSPQTSIHLGHEARTRRNPGGVQLGEPPEVVAVGHGRVPQGDAGDRRPCRIRVVLVLDGAAELELALLREQQSQPSWKHLGSLRSVLITV